MAAPRVPVRSLVLAGALALGAVACGSDRSSTSAGDTTAPPTSAAAGATTTADSGQTTTTAGTGAETTTTSAAVELPGEPIEIYPYEGTGLAVVGVEAGDALNLRSAPDPAAAVLAELAPTRSTDLTATGHNRTVSSGVWAQVRAGGVEGWVNVAYVSQLGGTDDITSELGAVTVAPGADVTAWGRAVAESRSSQEPPSRVVLVDGPRSGDLDEVVFDVVGLGDDSVAGERLHVFVDPDTNTLRSVERTTLCARGVADGGLCL